MAPILKIRINEKGLLTKFENYALLELHVFCYPNDEEVVSMIGSSFNQSAAASLLAII
jgi:hypothetical protein